MPPSGVDVALGDPTLVDTTSAVVPATIDGRATKIVLMLTQEGDGWKVGQVEIR